MAYSSSAQFCGVIDALATAIKMPAEVFVIELLIDRLAWGAINDRYATEVVAQLTIELDGFSRDKFTIVCIMAVFIETIISWKFALIISKLVGNVGIPVGDAFVVVAFEVLADTDTNICVVTAISRHFLLLLQPSEEVSLFGRGARSCWPTATCDCCDLQTWIPSIHVWPKLALPTFPQCPNQEPPSPQQLSLPDLAMVPHLGHGELVDIAGFGV